MSLGLMHSQGLPEYKAVAVQDAQRYSEPDSFWSCYQKKWQRQTQKGLQLGQSPCTIPWANAQVFVLVCGNGQVGMGMAPGAAGRRAPCTGRTRCAIIRSSGCGGASQPVWAATATEPPSSWVPYWSTSSTDSAEL